MDGDSSVSSHPQTSTPIDIFQTDENLSCATRRPIYSPITFTWLSLTTANLVAHTLLLIIWNALILLCAADDGSSVAAELIGRVIRDMPNFTL